jgi:hypothetical protein
MDSVDIEIAGNFPVESSRQTGANIHPSLHRLGPDFHRNRTKLHDFRRICRPPWYGHDGLYG